jgi:ubiquinone/menaquinone biosynthesis C-methylase UbiE
MTQLKHKKPYKGLPLEGFLARWYARTTGKDLGEFRKLAEHLAGQVASGGDVLEVAPGPGYLAIELAKRGPYRIVGLDISQTFVRMASENAARAGVQVTFRHGNVAAMPFEADSFDFIVCRAAFKNFTEPVQALNEMHRVLRPGGKALIIDLRRDASPGAIDTCVKNMKLGLINRLLTKLAFRCMLLRRAYTEEQVRQMAAATPFQTCDIQHDLIGMAITLTKASNQ